MQTLPAGPTSIVSQSISAHGTNFYLYNTLSRSANLAAKTSLPTNHAQALSYSKPSLTRPKVITAHSQYLTIQQLTNYFQEPNTIDPVYHLPAALRSKGWSSNHECLILYFNQYFDHNKYGIPRPVPIAYHGYDRHILMESASRYLGYNVRTDELYRIDHPTSLTEILNAMCKMHSGIQEEKLDRLPCEKDYRDTKGWSFDTETLGTLLQRVPWRKYGLDHLTPVIAHEEKGLLLFRRDFLQRLWDKEWDYFIWDQKSIHRVDEPTELDDTLDFLMSKGFPNNEDLKTTELKEV